MPIEIDVDKAVEAELAKRDRRIVKLEEKLAHQEQKCNGLENAMKAMYAAKEALLNAADYLDPYRYEDM